MGSKNDCFSLFRILMSVLLGYMFLGQAPANAVLRFPLVALPCFLFWSWSSGCFLPFASTFYQAFMLETIRVMDNYERRFIFPRISENFFFSYMSFFST